MHYNIKWALCGSPALIQHVRQKFVSCSAKADEHKDAKSVPHVIPKVLPWLFKHSLSPRRPTEWFAWLITGESYPMKG